MKSCAESGSISRRNRPTVSRWMRWRSRRSHHSSSVPPGRKLPRSTCPSDSSWCNASVTSSGGRARASESPVTATGPATSILPRTAASTATSRSTGASSGKGASGGSTSLSGKSAWMCRMRSAQTAKVRREVPNTSLRAGVGSSNLSVTETVSLAARPVATSASRRCEGTPSIGTRTAASSQSCSSSASRISGRASATTCSIARRVQRSEPGRVLGRQRPADLDRSRPALLERRVVEEGVGLRVEQRVRQRRRLGQVARDGLDLARPERPEHALQALHVHRLASGSPGAPRAPAGGPAARPPRPRGCPGSPPGPERPRASRSSARARWMCGGTRLPLWIPRRAPAPGWRSSGSASRTAAPGAPPAPAPPRRCPACRKSKMSSSGKLCCSPSERRMPSSVAAACSSKSKVRQKRLRSARPQARLMRPPNGAWRMSCIPPASSKKRSAMTVR